MWKDTDDNSHAIGGVLYQKMMMKKELFGVNVEYYQSLTNTDKRQTSEPKLNLTLYGIFIIITIIKATKKTRLVFIHKW